MILCKEDFFCAYFCNMRFFLLFLSFISLTTIQAQTWLSKEQVDLSRFIPERPHLSSVQCFEVTYMSDSSLVRGVLMEPKQGTAHPAIIFNRGGNREFATLSVGMVISVLGKVASEGYVVTASNYRWEDEFGGADTNDVLNLLAITRELPNVDPERIGMMGWSRGAMMTCQALKGRHHIKTAVLVSGAPNLFNTLEERPALEEHVFSKYILSYQDDKESALKERSPHYWADKLDRATALLMLNGTMDRHVDYRQTERFSAKLDSIGFPHQFHLFETNHGFSNMRAKLDSLLLQWFDKTLKQERKRVAITIDDVPNTRTFKNNSYQSKLLKRLDSLVIPVTIFINEGRIYKGDSTKNKELLEDWIKRSYVTPANHTFGHSRYSEVGYETFAEDVLKGERLSRQLSEEANKGLRYFRFPYNDLGKDSTQHEQIHKFLEENEYISTPFTVETSDWMFNALYRKYLKEDKLAEAEEIGKMYVDETVRTFAFFDSLLWNTYGRNVDQIYLCHDNRLNEDYLPKLIDRLEKDGYDFISLDEAMEDQVYHQPDSYWKKWGISWCYRWMNSEERKAAMKVEPNLGGIEQRYMEETREK